MKLTRASFVREKGRIIKEPPTRLQKQTLRIVQTPHTIDGRYDAVIAGGGAIGSALGMILSQAGLKVAIIEPKLNSLVTASLWNAGAGRRLHWEGPSLSLIDMTLKYLKNLGEKINYREKGYLWCHDALHFPGAVTNAEMIAKKFHVDMEVLTGLTEIQQVYPELKTTEGIPEAYREFGFEMPAIAGAIYSKNDCLFNPQELVGHYQRTARDNGTDIWEGFYITAVDPPSGNGYKTVRAKYVKPELDGNDGNIRDFMQKPLEAIKTSNYHQEISLATEQFIWCNGAWARWLYQGMDTPLVQPWRRQNVSYLGPKPTFEGLFVLPNGVYKHPEGTAESGHGNNDCLMIAGNALEGEPFTFNFNFDGKTFLDDYIIQYFLHSLSSYPNFPIRYVGGYAADYPQNMWDGQSIVDEDVLGGTSGHGMMISYGLAVLYFMAFILRDPEALALAAQFSAKRVALGIKLPSGLHI